MSCMNCAHHQQENVRNNSLLKINGTQDFGLTPGDTAAAAAIAITTAVAITTTSEKITVGTTLLLLLLPLLKPIPSKLQSEIMLALMPMVLLYCN